MARLRFAVIMLAWGMAARGAEVGDADSAMAARIEFLKGRECKDEGYITAHLNVSRNVRPPQNIQLIKTITVPLQTNERTLCYHK